MAIARLSPREQGIVLCCMKATAAYIDDSEKYSRLGIEADVLSRLIDEWPNIYDHDEDGNGFLAVNNCFNEVCHGFKIEAADWKDWFDCPKIEVESTYRKWRSLSGTSGGIR